MGLLDFLIWAFWISWYYWISWYGPTGFPPKTLNQDLFVPAGQMKKGRPLPPIWSGWIIPVRRKKPSCQFLLPSFLSWHLGYSSSYLVISYRHQHDIFSHVPQLDLQAGEEHFLSFPSMHCNGLLGFTKSSFQMTVFDDDFRWWWLFPGGCCSA